MAEIERAELKKKIKREAKKLGMNLIGFANVGRWEDAGEIDREFYPQTIWPWSKTVIVLAVQIFLPMIETTPSVVYSELYNTTNRLLDESAYKIANFMNTLGYRAFFFPRDCYGDISALVKKPAAAFSHVIAGKYAGLGTIGFNNTLITKEYGPRVRLVSVITDAEIQPDPVIEKNLCIDCRLCQKMCPTKAFTARNDRLAANMDKQKCAEYHQQLKNEFRYPCGICTAVCPVGKDRKIYGNSSVSKEGIAHCQDFGSLNAMSIIYLAGGCFWGLEKYLSGIIGVVSTNVGYANGKTKNPTYEDVKYGGTGHVETVRTEFDDNILSLQTLLIKYFSVIDPISVNKQGEDVGVQYRTGIYYTDDSFLPVISNVISQIEKQIGKKTAVEVKPLEQYFPAEDYHQKYLEKNPNGYCHIGGCKF